MALRLTKAVFQFEDTATDEKVIAEFIGDKVIIKSDEPLHMVTNVWASHQTERPNEVTRREIKPRVTDALVVIGQKLGGAGAARVQAAIRRASKR